MSAQNLDIEYMVKRYFEDKVSLSVISKETNIPTKTIERALKRNGYTLRTKQEAQLIAIQSGRAKSPADREWTDEDRANMSKKIIDYYKENKKQPSATGMTSWTKEQRDMYAKQGRKHIRETIKTGSKLEKYLLNRLTSDGYSVDFHTRPLENVKLEVDMYLPQYGVVLEIDGPSHVRPVWGPDAFTRTQQADAEKNTLALGHGLNVIRLRCHISQVRLYHMVEAYNKLIELLANIDQTKAQVYKLEITNE